MVCLHSMKCVYILFLHDQVKMARTLLSDEAWARIESVLPGKEGDPGRTAIDNRWFIEAVLWIGRTGCR